MDPIVVMVLAFAVWCVFLYIFERMKFSRPARMMMRALMIGVFIFAIVQYVGPQLQR